MPASKDLEILVTKIQKQLAPDAVVEHNAKLDGRNSKTKRQIDVLVRQQIGQYEMRIVLDCKDYARPVDVKGVEEFHGLVEDVGAHKGALVCPKGFTAAAKERATAWQIDLYSPIDTDPHKWQVAVTAPTICDFRTAMYSFRIAHSDPGPFRIPMDFYDATEVKSLSTGKELGTMREAVLGKWNGGYYPTEPGTHDDLTIFDAPQVLVDNGYGSETTATLTVSILVQQQLYFGHLPIPRISGFKDELSGKVIANAFSIGMIDPNEVERSWKPIDSIDEAPMEPLMTLVGLLGYAEN